MGTDKAVTIVELKAENVKRLKAVTVRPDGKPLVCIGGRNGQGKSSLLDSLSYALGGKAQQCERPVREGTEKAEICITLSNGLVVKRIIRPDGKGQVIVSNAEGALFPSPQTVLDGLYGQLTLDPLAFMRMDAKRQAQTLRDLVGLDLSALDGQYAWTYETRTEVNREVNRLEGQLAGMPLHEAPETEVSLSDLAARLQEAERTNAGNARVRMLPDSIEKEVVALEGQIDAITEQVRQLQNKKAELAEQCKEKYERLLDARQAALQVKDINTDNLRQQIQQAEQTNAKVRQNYARSAGIKMLLSKQAESEALTKRLEEISADKSAMLAAAKFPVDGLAFSADGVNYNGIPLEQCSSAEQLRISVAMAFAMQPELRIALIRDGSLLDSDSLRIVAEIARDAGGEVWVERVGRGEECAVIIEDGEVAEDRTAVAKEANQ